MSKTLTFASCTEWGIHSDSWVGLTFICGVPPSCPPDQPVMPIYHQPRQNQAEGGTRYLGGTAKIKVNSTQVCQETGHPVHNTRCHTIRHVGYDGKSDSRTARRKIHRFQIMRFGRSTLWISEVHMRIFAPRRQWR